ncbi:DUF6205 family protein [Streptomyces sp. NPDC005708]|uniref:DUF6205 family protein n=1 Tax=unclassified Streptomyces TaxID=2593676 RepID=UPI0033EC0C76
MSYTTRVKGGFAIHPPLTWGEIKDSLFAPHNITQGRTPELMLCVAEEDVDTVDGPLLRRTATALASIFLDGPPTESVDRFVFCEG